MKQDSTSRIDSLIEKAVNNDRDAMESLLLHFYDPLLAFARGSVRPEAGIAPEDLVQIAMSDAFQNIWRLEPKGGDAFFAWLKTIARNRLSNLIEAQRARKRGAGRGPAPRVLDSQGEERSILRLIAGSDRTPSLIARRNEASGALRKALGQLDPQRRRLIAMRYEQGLSYQEIAAREAKNVGAIKMHVHRAIKELRDLMIAGTGRFSIGD